MNRASRAKLAAETVRICDEGFYEVPGGGRVSISAQMSGCLEGTRFYDPEALEKIEAEALGAPRGDVETGFEVANETSLEGAARLATSAIFSRVGVLNFASAKNPGGGFLGGSRAQEESLARSSGLYKSLCACPEYYEFHRQQRSPLYSDRMIYSPGCPVFRNDEGQLLAEPYAVDFITSPAPNAGAVEKNKPKLTDQIEPTLLGRSLRLLCLAAHRECDALVLGAWGCGVFKNDPVAVAEAFHAHLGPGGPLHGTFRRVLFSVLDRSEDKRTYGAFAARFG